MIASTLTGTVSLVSACSALKGRGLDAFVDDCHDVIEYRNDQFKASETRCPSLR
jgi:hypothetical protein